MPIIPMKEPTSHLMIRGEKYGHVYSTSAQYWEEEGNTSDYQFTINSSNALDVITSHFNKNSEKLDFSQLLGEKEIELGDCVSPLTIILSFNGVELNDEARDSCCFKVLERDQGYILLEVEEYSEAILFIKESAESEYGEIYTEENLEELEPTDSVHLFMTDIDYREMIQYLRGLVDRINEFYERSGIEQMHWEQ